MNRLVIQGLLDRKGELEEELIHLNFLIEKHYQSSATAELKLVPRRFHLRRVRGVLAATKEVVAELSEPFDKNDVMIKLRSRDLEFARKISAENLRNALRLLAQEGTIEIHTAATSTSCAKYVRAA